MAGMVARRRCPGDALLGREAASEGEKGDLELDDIVGHLPDLVLYNKKIESNSQRYFHLNKRYKKSILNEDQYIYVGIEIWYLRANQEIMPSFTNEVNIS
jgi:hypothetical protein